MKSTCGQPHELVEVCRQACNRVKAVGEIRSEEGRFLFRKGKMPIDDERRRLSRTKAMPGTAPQIRTSAIGEPEPKERVEESLQRLYEMVLLERAKQVEFCEREEERVQTQRQAVQRARNDRNERHDRLQQAFERLDRWRGEEGAEAAREESRRSQGTIRLPCPCQDLAADRADRRRWISSGGGGVGAIPSTTHRRKGFPRK